MVSGKLFSQGSFLVAKIGNFSLRSSNITPLLVCVEFNARNISLFLLNPLAEIAICRDRVMQGTRKSAFYRIGRRLYMPSDDDLGNKRHNQKPKAELGNALSESFASGKSGNFCKKLKLSN